MLISDLKGPQSNTIQFYANYTVKCKKWFFGRKIFPEQLFKQNTSKPPDYNIIIITIIIIIIIISIIINLFQFGL